MRRVVITGLGAVSCLGNTKDEIVDSLKNGRSGIVANESYKELGLRSQISGSVNIDIAEHIDRKVRRFMGDAAAYAYIAMQKAIDDAGLEDGDISNVRTGLIAGSGGASSANNTVASDKPRAGGVRKIGPYMVPRTMASTVTPRSESGVRLNVPPASSLPSGMTISDMYLRIWYSSLRLTYGVLGSRRKPTSDM